MATITLLSLALLAPGAVPSYDSYQIQARSNFTVNGPAFNLPGNAFFANATIAINDAAQVAFRLDVVPGGEQKAVWFGGDGAGTIVYTTPGTAFALVGQPSLNDDGLIAMEQDFVAPAGILRIVGASGANQIVVGPGGPFGLTGWGSARINATGQVGFRGAIGFSGQAWISRDLDGGQVAHAVEAGVDPQSPYSFLFTPDFNDARQIAGKVRLGAVGQTGNERPDEIRVFSADGSSTLIARDVDGDPASPFKGFDNSVSLLSDGRVAFIADRVAGGRGVYLSDGSAAVEIARSGVGEVGAIEFFAPDANDDGLVVFRAFDSSGLRAVWAGDGATLVRVVTEHDILPSDLGPARVDQETASSPVFAGGPTVNAAGDVAFHCGLAPPDNNQIEWGSAAYVAYATPSSIPGDITGDGVVDGADLGALLAAWGSADEGADLDGSGVVDGADLGALLSLWGSG